MKKISLLLLLLGMFFMSCTASDPNEEIGLEENPDIEVNAIELKPPPPPRPCYNCPIPLG